MAALIGAPGAGLAAIDTNTIARLREEGLNRSQVMETLSYLTDVIGPRLTGSPALKRANEWTRDRLVCWGLTNAHLEAVPFGRGWQLKRFSVQVVAPQSFPLIAYPKAWSPGLKKAVNSEVVYLDATSTNDLVRYKGQLAGAIVLVSAPREIEPPFEPIATRQNASNLLTLANAGLPADASATRSSGRSRLERTVSKAVVPNGENVSDIRGTNRFATASVPRTRSSVFPARVLDFLMREGAVLAVNNSSMGQGGTVFVSSALLPDREWTHSKAGTASTNAPRAWWTNAPATLPQITMASEDYNRLVRMLKAGEKVRMALDFQADFENDDYNAYNTVAEIPGTDLKEEMVMLGAHLDSWHSGTGATDNAIGAAVMMEAVRIIKALDLHPRRTIRIGLWAGEEQGFLGSKAYLASHVGYWTNTGNSKGLRAPKDSGAKSPDRSGRRLVQLPDYRQISAYFNLDNGAGKIRGIYLQGNEALRPLFREWLQPFKDLGADTVSISNTSGTDHIPFNEIGVPGFQFIQDWIDYGRTHHSNQDVYDRVIPEDAKQASVVLAGFAYSAAMVDEKLPRKPLSR